MSNPLLVLGNKRYSSWSLRGYLALALSGLAFDEKVIPLFLSDTHEKMKKIAPNAPAKVPKLVEGETVIWDSLSLMEYAAENSQKGDLWPADRNARAYARSVSAEMHSGFEALRGHVPMNLSRKDAYVPMPEDVQVDIDRILQIWQECRTRFGDGGPFLFGKLSLADVAYAPVVARFKSRSVPVDNLSETYMDAVWNLPEFIQWRKDAANEEWVIEQ